MNITYVVVPSADFFERKIKEQKTPPIGFW
jgi:hypothetical protein